MTTKNSKAGTTKTKKTTAAAPAKVTSGTKRAVKRERVQMVKPTPSSPMPAPVFDAPAPVVAQPEKLEAAPVALKPVKVEVAVNAPVALKPAKVEVAVNAPVATASLKPAKVEVAVNAPAATASLKPVVNGAANVAMKTTQPAERRIERADFELLVRRAAYQLAQRRQFRGGSPAQDWFAAETAVKAGLQARGFTLAS